MLAADKPKLVDGVGWVDDCIGEMSAKTGVPDEGGTGVQATEIRREVSCTTSHECKGELGSLSDGDSSACRGSLPPSCDVFAWGTV